MKIPGPDHPITIEPNPNRVRVVFAGRTIADSTHALTLREASYKPAIYIPRDDVDMSALERTDHSSYCPYKGDCSYFSLQADGKVAENAVWSYEAAYEAVRPITSYLAFYPSRVDAIEESPTD